jgi:methionine-rich copper-binding protein CopC
MNRTKRSQRLCLDLACDWLEARVALTGGTSQVLDAPLGPYLSVVSTSPADGSTINSSPQNLVLTFDRPLDPNFIGFGDVLLDQVNSDGSLTPIFDPNLGVQEDLDSTGYVLTVPIDQTLLPGNYEILLSAQAMLMGLDGSSPASAINGVDEPVANFTVVPTPATLNPPTDLQLLTPGVVTSVGGSLDLSNNPNDASLYSFTLPDGHHWRLGLEVDAARIGSLLTPQLSLFNSQGQLLETSNLGRADAPTDPYLFAGLGPGTYYVGVSGAGNIGGTVGGYNVLTLDPGTSGTQQAGGQFALRASIVPADSATTLINFQTTHVDPLDPTPTGISLQFSGPLNLGSQANAIVHSGNSAIEVVDASGRTWPVQLSNYDEANAEVNYLFSNALPAGNYTVVIPASGGLTDLAGYTPQTPGLPSHVLATFNVGHGGQSHDPFNLGTPAPNAILAGISGETHIPTSHTLTYRFVSQFDNFYQFATSTSRGGVQVQFVEVATGRTVTLQTALPGQSLTQLVGLHQGVYLINITAEGPHTVSLDWKLWMSTVQPDSILANGVGQGPALNLQLIAPGVSAAPDSPATPVAPGNSSTSPAPFSASNGSSAVDSPASESAPAAPAPHTQEGEAGISVGAATSAGGLFLGVNPALVGRPLDQSSAGAVGPGTGTTVTLSATGFGQANNIAARLEASWASELGFGELASGLESVADAGDAEPDLSGSLTVPVAQVATESLPATAPEVSWTDRIKAALGSGAPTLKDLTMPTAPASLANDMLADAAAQEQPGPTNAPDRYESAHIGVSTPLIAGIVAVVVARSHQSLHSWFRGSKRIALATPHGSQPVKHI